MAAPDSEPAKKVVRNIACPRVRSEGGLLLMMKDWVVTYTVAYPIAVIERHASKSAIPIENAVKRSPAVVTVAPNPKARRYPILSHHAPA